MTYDIKQTIAPKGHLRVGINMSNFLLVVGKNEDGDPIGISPDIAKLIAKKIDEGFLWLELDKDLTYIAW